MFTEKMHGLPYQLLRGGARTVVASPWPLDVLVVTKWAPVFAKQLAKGDAVSRGVFAANQSLRDRPPKDRLAMHVYGDPWLRFRSKEQDP